MPVPRRADEGRAVREDPALMDGEIGVREGTRLGCVVIPDAEVGEDSPRLLPVTAVIDGRGRHIFLHVNCDVIHVSVDCIRFAMDKDS
jgi:hypothetical protein